MDRVVKKIGLQKMAKHNGVISTYTLQVLMDSNAEPAVGM